METRDASSILEYKIEGEILEHYQGPYSRNDEPRSRTREVLAVSF